MKGKDLYQFKVFEFMLKRGKTKGGDMLVKRRFIIKEHQEGR